jgi:hypothetical protein
MMDFVRVMADYLDDDAILTRLAQLENAGVYTWQCREASRLAKTLVGKDRFLYAINRLFSIVGWQLHLAPLEEFLRRQFGGTGRHHTFVSFNYDLALDRAVQLGSDGAWHPADGYGFTIPYFTPEGPLRDKEAGVLESWKALPFVPGEGSSRPIQILKPHGSLNWLLPFRVPYRTDQHGLALEPEPMVIPLQPEYELRYWSTTATFNHIQRPNELPHDHGIFIIPPSSGKPSGMSFLDETRTREAEAVREADEFFIIGYSLPVTDVDQESLIRCAVRERSVEISRLVAVNYGAPPDYFRRVGKVFAFPEDRLEVFNAGFVDLASAF